MKKLLTLLVILLTLHTAPAWATTYYVHPTSGSNGNSCTTAQSSTANQAKQTIAAGIGCLAAGDTLRLHAGTYSDASISTATTDIPNGSSANYNTATIIESYNGTVTWNFPGSAAFIML
jgi:hypothetical protein